MSWRTWIAFFALGIIWGLPYFLIKIALLDLAPAEVAWGRITIGALILLPLAWRRGALRTLRAHWGAVFAFAFAELVAPFSLIALGETWISSSLAGILLATLPLTVILLAPLFGLREPLGRRRILGLGIGFAGVVILLGIGSVQGLMAWVGVGCMIFATIGYASAALIVQRYLKGVDELGALAMSLAIASVVLLPVAALTAPHHPPPLSALVCIAVLGVVCTAIPLQLYFYLINRAGAARTAVITYINPAVATLLGVGILHEPFGLGPALGLILILLGSWLGTHHADVPAAQLEST